MRKNVFIFICFLGFSSLFSVLFYNITNFGIFLTLSISFCTTFYHFIYRFIIAAFLDVSHNKKLYKFYVYNNFWFKEKKYEKKIYKILKVKIWKHKVPTWSPESFSLKNHSKEELVLSTCQAEFIHEVNCILSFIPIIASIPFGKFWVFFFTSLFSAIFELIFVIVQRFNRPRLLNLIKN